MYRILLLHEMPEYDSCVQDYLQLAGYEVVKELLTERKYESELRCYDLIIFDNSKLETLLKVVKVVRKKVQIPIVVLSEQKEEYEKVKLFPAGIDDYIVKPYGQGEFLARIQAHIERYKRLTKPFGIIRIDNLVINAFSRKVYLKDDEIELRLKEFDVLLYLAKHMNKVVTKQELYEAVWGDNLSDGLYNSVAVHVKKLRGKIEEDINNPRYIETVWGVGYRLRS